MKFQSSVIGMLVSSNFQVLSLFLSLLLTVSKFHSCEPGKIIQFVPLTVKDAGFWEVVFFGEMKFVCIKFSLKLRSKYFRWKLRCSAIFWHLILRILFLPTHHHYSPITHNHRHLAQFHQSNWHMYLGL